MISFGCLFLEFFPFFKLFIVRKTNSIDPLQGLSLSVALPVGGAVLGDLQCFHLARVSDVGPPAQVYQGTTPVDSRGWSVHLLIQYSDFEWIVFKHFK